MMEHYYAQNITDEYIRPTALADISISANDGVIFSNFREDRARQLTACFIAPELINDPSIKLRGTGGESVRAERVEAFPLSFFISSIRYDARFNNTVLLNLTPVRHTLKEVLSNHDKTIFSVAETEKYAHVTYFFADGREQTFAHETRVIIPSLVAKNYVDYPQMSAQQITDAVIDSLNTNPCDFYLINYANADMVGHSGNLAATIKAIECIDNQLKQLYEQLVKKMNGMLYITADHGNAEIQFDTKTKQPHTAHTTNPVPFYMGQ